MFVFKSVFVEKYGYFTCLDFVYLLNIMQKWTKEIWLHERNTETVRNIPGIWNLQETKTSKNLVLKRTLSRYPKDLFEVNL